MNTLDVMKLEKLKQYKVEDVEDCINELLFYRNSTQETLLENINDYIEKGEYDTVCSMSHSLSDSNKALNILIDVKELIKPKDHKETFVKKSN